MWLNSQISRNEPVPSALRGAISVVDRTRSVVNPGLLKGIFDKSMAGALPGIAVGLVATAGVNVWHSCNFGELDQ
jgi:hypothetical protein